MRNLPQVTPLFGALLVAACGGTEDLSQLPAPEVTEDALAAEQPLRAEVLALVNAARAAGATCGDEVFPPVPPLKEDARLVRSAANHADDMCSRQFFGSTNPNGKSPFDRMKASGYSFSYAAENIAAGQVDAESVVKVWMNSPGHCRNIMSADYTDVGTGHYFCQDKYGHYWTQNFAKPK